MLYMLDKIVYKFGAVKYRLMAVLVFFFMAMGSLVGSFEEVVPMVPLIVSLAIGLGESVSAHTSNRSSRKDIRYKQSALHSRFCFR